MQDGERCMSNSRPLLSPFSFYLFTIGTEMQDSQGSLKE